MSDILLSASSHLRLYELSQIEKTNRTASARITTGRRHQTLSDDSRAVLQSASLRALASDLRSYRQNIVLAQNALTQSENAIQGVKTALQSISRVSNNMLSVGGNGTAQTQAYALGTKQLQGLFAEVRGYIQTATNDAGMNLLNNTATVLQARINTRETSSVTVAGFDLIDGAAGRRLFTNTQGADIFNATGQFNFSSVFTNIQGGFSNVTNTSEIASGFAHIRTAITRLGTVSVTLAASNQALTARLNLNDKQEVHLLNRADIFNGSNDDVEATLASASQTRYQLAIESLAFRSRRAQAILSILQ